MWTKQGRYLKKAQSKIKEPKPPVSKPVPAPALPEPDEVEVSDVPDPSSSVPTNPPVQEDSRPDQSDLGKTQPEETAPSEEDQARKEEPETPQPPPREDGEDRSEPGSRDARNACESGSSSIPPNGMNMFTSALSLHEEGILPKGPSSGGRNNYNIGSGNWPAVVPSSSSGEKLTVNFGSESDKQSMCTSATASGLVKYLVDLHNAGKLKLSQKIIDFISDKGRRAPFKNGINGDTFSPAVLVQALGGKSVHNPKWGNQDQMVRILKMAKPGDILKWDRKLKKGYSGHSVIFKEFKNGQVCFWSSQKKPTKGAGERCMDVNKLGMISVSRLPEDICVLQNNLDKAVNDELLAGRLSSSEKRIPPNWVKWHSNIDTSPVAKNRNLAGVEENEVEPSSAK